jgi:hypothetical protein
MKLLLALFVVYIHNGVGKVKFANEIITIELPGWFSYYSYALSEVVPRCAVSGSFFMSSLLLYRKEFTWLVSKNILKNIGKVLVEFTFSHALSDIENEFTSIQMIRKN